MPWSASWRPRTMLPPPITMPTSTFKLTTSRISSANRSIVTKSNPRPLPPASASPDSLRRTRGYLTSQPRGPLATADSAPAATSLLLAHLEPSEPSHGDLLAHLGREFVHQIGNRLLGIAHPLLVQQGDVLVERLDLAGHDLVDQVLGLPALAHLLLEDAALALDTVGRDAVLVHAHRVGRGDMLGDLLDQGLELGVPGDEIGLAVDLDEDADLAVVMDIGADNTLAGDLAGALLGLDRALGAEPLGGLIHIAVGLFQCLLRVHHARAGPLAELLDVFRRKCRG